jgi:hypothetical protein
MTIVDAKIYAPDKNWYSFVELITDTGIAGWGAAYSQKAQVVGAFEWLKRFVIGENPLEIERVTEKLHQITFWIGRGGAMTHAISGQGARPVCFYPSWRPPPKVGTCLWVSAVSPLGRSSAADRSDEGYGLSRDQARMGTVRPPNSCRRRKTCACRTPGGRGGSHPSG